MAQVIDEMKSELKNLIILIIILIFGYCIVQGTNTLRITYQASTEYDQANEQRFRDNVSQRLQELEGR